MVQGIWFMVQLIFKLISLLVFFGRTLTLFVDPLTPANLLAASMAAKLFSSMYP